MVIFKLRKLRSVSVTVFFHKLILTGKFAKIRSLPIKIYFMKKKNYIRFGDHEFEV